MSLRARIRRAEAQLDWLDAKGPVRRCELDLAWLEMKEAVEARLKANPGNEKARRMARMLGLVLPPLPKPPPLKPHPEEPRETRRLEGCEPAPCPLPILRDAVLRTAPQDEVVRMPPAPPEPPSPPEPSHDIPEHMQVRPTRWRQRDATDIDDWENDGTYGRCLTEYDVLAGEDD